MEVLFMPDSSTKSGQERVTPQAGRPHMPGYGILEANEGSGLFPWSHVAERMTESRNYWIGTTCPDGRPHVMPVWGVWVEGAFYFATSRTSVKGRNIAADPRISVHLESGDDAIILEGVAEKATDRQLLVKYADVYDEKYQYRPDPDDAGSITLTLQPRIAFAWLEKDFPGSATRWQME
jgi:general stress protein 26